MPPKTQRKNTKEFSFVYDSFSKSNDFSSSSASASTSTSAKQMTNEELFRKLVARYEVTEKKLDGVNGAINELRQTQSVILSRLEALENRNSELDGNHVKLKDAIQSLTESTQRDLQQMRNSVMEETERVKRLNNLILLGVPETEDGLALASKILKEILPENNVRINQKLRIGKEVHDGRPRPLRVPVANAIDRNAALETYYAIQNKDHFQGVYVKNDLTKLQQEQRRTKNNEGQSVLRHKPIAAHNSNKKSRLSQSSNRFGSQFPFSKYQPQSSQFNVNTNGMELN